MNDRDRIFLLIDKELTRMKEEYERFDAEAFYNKLKDDFDTFTASQRAEFQKLLKEVKDALSDSTGGEILLKLEALRKEVEKVKDINTSLGEDITINNSGNFPLSNLIIYGKTDVNGVLGGIKNITVTVTDERSYNETIFISSTLNGIRVSSGENYTDSNGQKWLSDYVDFKRGVIVRNCDGSNTIEPYEEKLSQSIIQSFNRLKTQYPTTYIRNNRDAYMEVEYLTTSVENSYAKYDTQKREIEKTYAVDKDVTERLNKLDRDKTNELNREISNVNSKISNLSSTVDTKASKADVDSINRNIAIMEKNVIISEETKRKFKELGWRE